MSNKIKKNKKYWKREAKSWREIAEMETESANNWAGEAFILQDELEELKVEFIKIKNELKVLRQYNIGKPNGWDDVEGRYAGSNDIWEKGFGSKPPIENNVIDMWKNKWSKNTPSNLSNFSVPPKKCNCKNCDCDK